ERELERVGGTEMLRCDVRVISATNRNLHSAIAVGSFRSDLFYRLNVFPIELPPLRERKDDIPILVNYFVNRYAQRAGKKIDTIRKKSIEALQEYSWPGNVRELQNVIERSLIIVDTNEFSVDKNWLSHEFQSSRRVGPASGTSTEQEQIKAALAQTKGKVSGRQGAAAILGIPASTLESKIRRNWAMAAESSGYRAALARHQLTLGLISSLRGTAGSPPFISFSTSYPELDFAGTILKRCWVRGL